MPTMYTHYKFGNDVLNKLSNDIQGDIKRYEKYYAMFNQGFDNLFYYHLNFKYYKNFGVKAHKNNVGLFFKSIFEYLNNHKNINHYNIIYGFINHYTLDTLMHPLINAEVKTLDIPHTKIEYMIDYYLYDKEYNNMWKPNFYKTLVPKLKFDKDLVNLLDYAFFKAHGQKNIGKIFNISHNNGYYAYRYLIFDSKGIKSQVCKLVDKLNKNKYRLSENTLYMKHYNNRVLNLEKNEWINPYNTKEKYNYSILEIYEYSLIICKKLNEMAYQILKGKKNLEEFLNIINLINIKNIPKLLKKLT